MELRHLRYFVAVAEHASVRGASEQLHVTQPAISRQIQDLEETLGVALFERTPRGLKLTLAGDAYLREARGILKQVESAARVAQRIAAGVSGHVRMGFVENAVWGGLVPNALQAFQQAAPQVGIELTPMNTPEQLGAIDAGQLDGGFIYHFGALPEQFVSLPLLENGVVLAAPVAWSFGRRKSVRAAQLAGKPFITFPRRVYPAYYDRLIGACERAGLTLDVVQEVSTEAAILSLVSAGVGAAIVNSANRERPPALVQFLALSDLSIALPLHFAYHEQHRNPALAQFIALLKAQN
ncbi:LysR family transcriptional regulator [Paraburkholderia aromaticivorans]|uniref:LysR family transcriptional regulator n=1 Tax=Paraburkholderia aromaticivorans TaxID=2026199 RepID=UPI001455E336|nr:LysR family transcriptional regulator [Paraburkholderia aromaticivorans]